MNPGAHARPCRRRSHDRIRDPPQPHTLGHVHILAASTDTDTQPQRSLPRSTTRFCSATG
jgi:hypothetical protein